MTADAAGPRDPDARLREAERSLFAHYGLTPAESVVHLGDPDVSVRLLEFGADGAGSGAPPILLLHGIASVTAVAAPLIAYLAPGRRVIAVDWPGHGLSGPIRLKPGEPVRRHAVTVLRGICSALGIDRADVVGHSMGAQSALYFSLDAPELVRRLVTLGAPGAGFSGVRPVPAMRAASVPGLGPALLGVPMPLSAVRRTTDGMIGKGLIDRYPPEMLEIGFLVGRRSGYASSVASFFRALITPIRVRPGVCVPIDELAKLTQPTLLVWGDSDVFMTADAARESIEAIANHRLVRVAGGHMPWLNEPETCGDAVASFLNAP